MNENLKEMGNDISKIIALNKKNIHIGTMDRLNCIPDVKSSGVFELTLDMIRDCRKGSYRLLSTTTVLTLIGCFIYMLFPWDIIPESLGITGILDDIAVFAFALRTIYEEVCAYKLWLATRDLSLKDAYKLINKVMAEMNENI